MTEGAAVGVLGPPPGEPSSLGNLRLDGSVQFQVFVDKIDLDFWGTECETRRNDEKNNIEGGQEDRLTGREAQEHRRLAECN